MEGAGKMKKVAIILGTRPQIIKSAPVFKAFHGTNIDCAIINTGQHYDYEMNREFFIELDLPEPEANLEVGAGTPNEQISRIIAGLETHLAKIHPDLAIVPGDTNSALAAGIACSKLGIRIAHLESGCRSNDFAMAEEINRRVLDQVSHVLLCPTRTCSENLKSEHVLAEVIENVGDTMFDSILQLRDRISASQATARYQVGAQTYAFMTLHRAENVDDRKKIISILAAVDSFGVPILFSVHPRTRSKIEQFNIPRQKNITFIDPLPYFDALKLVKDSRFVITDSGGLQKEAFWLGRPTLILRDVTEWIEIVQSGAAILAGTDYDKIVKGNMKISSLETASLFTTASQLFGDGHAARRVVDTLTSYLSSH
jgi:UDP-GlcNAc3NAcA epimerase